MRVTSEMENRLGDELGMIEAEIFVCSREGDPRGW